jgi:hypothetical protein
MKILAAPIVLALVMSGAAAGDKDKRPKITVKANPTIAMAPARIVVTADVTGGADDNEEFYCPSIQWDWGDGTKTEESGDCDPYEAGKSTIKRRFTAEHEYHFGGRTETLSDLGGDRMDARSDARSDYRIQFRLKKHDKVIGSGSTAVKIKPGIGGTLPLREIVRDRPVTGWERVREG